MISVSTNNNKKIYFIIITLVIIIILILIIIFFSFYFFFKSKAWYPSLMDSGILNSTQAHQARVLNGQFFFFLIKISMSAGVD